MELFFAYLLYTQISYDPVIDTFVNRVKLDSVIIHITRAENFWTRHYRSDSTISARNWIFQKFQNYGMDSVYLDEFFYGGLNQGNVIGDRYGTIYNTPIFLIGAHYDSRGANWNSSPYGPAPGADDNGTGIALLLEIARVFQELQFEYTIRFVAFAAEEPGLVGSEHYADKMQNENVQIQLMVNGDMFGGDADYVNNRVIVEWDQGNIIDSNDAKSLAYAETLGIIYKIYTSLDTIYGPIFGSDYLPFEAKGYTCIGVFEENWNSTYHSIYDIIDSMDINYATEIIKGVLALIMHIAKYQYTFVAEVPFFPKKIEKKQFSFVGDKIPSFILKNIKEEEFVFDLMGRKILKINKNTPFLSLPSGIYFIKGTKFVKIKK